MQFQFLNTWISLISKNNNENVGGKQKKNIVASMNNEILVKMLVSTQNNQIGIEENNNLTKSIRTYLAHHRIKHY